MVPSSIISMQCNAFEGHRPSEGQLCLLSPLSQHTHTHIQACMHTRECEWVKVTQLCLTLCDPVDYTVHGILQARILEWVTFPFSRGSSQPRDRTQVSALQADSLPAEPQGKHTHEEYLFPVDEANSNIELKRETGNRRKTVKFSHIVHHSGGRENSPLVFLLLPPPGN